MEVNLELNGRREKAEVSFVQTTDFAFAKNWKDSIGNDQNPIRTDTVDYADLAVKRYEASFESGVYANSLIDFGDHIASNPKIEVGGFIILRCKWFPGSEIIGFAHFRRTWCNRIILDYLGSHPLIVRPPEDTTHKVRGVGVALLYFITQVFKKENCTALWGEATSSSGTFYQKVFNLDRVEDLIYVPRENVILFGEESERKWATPGDAISPTNQPLDLLYTLEIENPPFIGSKMAIFNPSKRLSFRFLKLPYHKQIEIAKTLHFIEDGDSVISREHLARIVFRSARELGMLSELWRSVEAGYGEEMAIENPFESIQQPKT